MPPIGDYVIHVITDDYVIHFITGDYVIHVITGDIVITGDSVIMLYMSHRYP